MQRKNGWWHRLRPKLTILYLVIALLLLVISGLGHVRLLQEVDNVFGGFTWTINPDGAQNEIVIISVPPQLPPFALSADSLTSSSHIIAVNGASGKDVERAYQQARPGENILYKAQVSNTQVIDLQRPASTFSTDMWWQTFGMTFVAGLCWLVVGCLLLATAKEWTGAVEGITMLPAAILLLLYSHWGNIQTAGYPNAFIQLIWIPSFALLGAAFIHLSLNYRPERMIQAPVPHWLIDGLPYLPLAGLLLYEWVAYFLLGHVPLRINILLSLGYAAFGGIVSLAIGLTSILHISNILPLRKQRRDGTRVAPVPAQVRHYLGDLFALWIGGIGLGFCLGVLPILLTGKTLLPLPIFYTLAAVYPLILLYAIRSLRMITQLHVALEQKDEALHMQQRTAEALQKSNAELQQATSLLLHADAHLRSLLSQRIHDQPKQQALRIRSLLGHWQHKIRMEADRGGNGQVNAQPLVEAIGKVRKISEELEGDLRGLQMLVEDAYQRRSLGLKLHLEKLIREDLPMLHPESPLQIQSDLWALDALTADMEQSEEGEKIAEAISYTVTQALLNIYNHAGANFAVVRTFCENMTLEIQINDDGRGFDPEEIAPEKTSMFKARLKVREAHGTLSITSRPKPQLNHGTYIRLQMPLPVREQGVAQQQEIRITGDR